MKRILSLLVAASATLIALTTTNAQKSSSAGCQNLPSESQLRQLLVQAQNVNKPIGGLFEGTLMWAAVVNRDGAVCAYNTSTGDATQVWPGSQAIAKSKAYTANAFSSLGQSNLFNPQFLAPPSGQDGGQNSLVGGLIFFGGGVPLYRNGKIVGALGVSGDTACADHEIAKRMRDLAGLNPPGGALADDIVYSGPDAPSVFAHPVCLNTYRNGMKIGSEEPATYPFVPPASGP